MKISFIICSYNRCVLLGETLECLLTSIQKDKYANSFFEVIVIDNNSNDDTKPIVDKFKNEGIVKYICEYEQGLSHARNRGMEESSGDILVFLDDDVDVSDKYIEQIILNYTQHRCTIVGGKVLPYKIQVPVWLPKQYFYLVSIFDLGNKRVKTNKLMGANYSMLKDVALKVGLYNVNLGRNGTTLAGGEEVDYLDRAQKLGFDVIYDPELVVYHKINNKLNRDYILGYAYNLGGSEYIIDINNTLVKVYLKILKGLLISMLSLCFKPLFSKKLRFWFDINTEYAKGYFAKFM